MKLFSLLVLFLDLTLASHSGQVVEEELFIVHLPDGRTMTHFQFSVQWDMHPLILVQDFKVRHYGVFPKSLAEVVSHYRVQELHLSLTQGKWRTQIWGYPPISAPPGAELWTWFLPEANAEFEWGGLVSAMSGLLCAHLNAIGPKSTYNPLYSFKPQGVVLGNVSSSQMRYAALPRETVCTENFTPWTKLLPCGTSAGLSSLFSTLLLYDTDYHSLGLHFKPVCLDEDCTKIGIELKQTLTVVYNPFINSKGYIDWTLKTLFGKVLKSACPLATSSVVHVAKESYASGLSFTVHPPPLMASSSLSPGKENWLTYDLASILRNGSKFDVSVKSASMFHPVMPTIPVLNVQRFLSGSGHEWGGLHTEITNNHVTDSRKVLFLDMIPWFCRVYIHTLQVENAKQLYKHYQPAKDRQKPHMMELLLEIPAQSTALITVQFNRAFLKWTEHPPDAHHGFYINSAVVTTVLADCTNCSLPILNSSPVSNDSVLRLHTESILVSLPTPDFSMPYNVICFVCTVIAIGFGSIFNLTTRRLEPATPENTKGLLAGFLHIIVSLHITPSLSSNVYSSHVQMVRNTLTRRFLTLSCSNKHVGSVLSQNSPNNFILVSDINNQTRFLKPFDSALFLSKRSAEDDRCEHEPTVFTIHAASSVHLDPPAASTNVKLYIAEENNNIEERWYLRVHTITHQVSLECQSALDNATAIEQQEFTFDILLVPEIDLD